MLLKDLKTIEKIIGLLRISTKNMQPTLVFSIIEAFSRDPFLILISCLLGLRSRDSTVFPICYRLFQVAKTPEAIVHMPLSELHNIIYSVGFYRNKALIIKHVSSEVIARFKGKVPCTSQELLSIKGIGPKTAALVLAEGFGIPAICVDVHVHRISNRLGIVQTKTPKETEEALKELLPKKYWIEINTLLVKWGQNICLPVSPKCSQCPLFTLCDRVGVKKSR